MLVGVAGIMLAGPGHEVTDYSKRDGQGGSSLSEAPHVHAERQERHRAAVDIQHVRADRTHSDSKQKGWRQPVWQWLDELSGRAVARAPACADHRRQSGPRHFQQRAWHKDTKRDSPEDGL